MAKMKELNDRVISLTMDFMNLTCGGVREGWILEEDPLSISEIEPDSEVETDG